MLWVSMSVCMCEGHMGSPIYPGPCGRICVLTSWPVAGAEAEARGSVLLQDFLWGCMWSRPPGKCTLELTVLGVRGFVSQVELSNPRARFRQQSWTWGRDSSQDICYPTE